MKISEILARRPEELHRNDPWLDKAFYVSAGLLFLLYFVTPFLFSFFIEEFRAIPEDVRIFLVVVPHQALLLAGMFFTAAFAGGGAKPGEISSRLGFSPCGFADLRYAVLLALLVVPLSFVANNLVYIISSYAGVELAPPVVNELLTACSWPGFAVIAFGALVLAPLGEEIIFRRIIFCYASKYVSVIGAAVISSTLFAAAHFNIRHFAGLFILGLALQFLYIRSRSLYPCIALHFLQNLISVTGIFIHKLN